MDQHRHQKYSKLKLPEVGIKHADNKTGLMLKYIAV